MMKMLAVVAMSVGLAAEPSTQPSLSADEPPGSLSAALATEPATEPFMSVDEFLDHERDAPDKAQGSAFVLTYLAGAIEAFQTANAYLVAGGHTAMFCLADGISTVDLRNLLHARATKLRALAGEREFAASNRDTDLALFANMTLREEFPCR